MCNIIQLQQQISVRIRDERMVIVCWIPDSVNWRLMSGRFRIIDVTLPLAYKCTAKASEPGLEFSKSIPLWTGRPLGRSINHLHQPLAGRVIHVEIIDRFLFAYFCEASSVNTQCGNSISCIIVSRTTILEANKPSWLHSFYSTQPKCALLMVACSAQPNYINRSKKHISFSPQNVLWFWTLLIFFPSFLHIHQHSPA